MAKILLPFLSTKKTGILFVLCGLCAYLLHISMLSVHAAEEGKYWPSTTELRQSQQPTPVPENVHYYDMSGQKINLESLKGKVIFFHLWATWCPPCRKEFPALVKMMNHFKNNKDFVIVSISLDSVKTRATSVPAFLSKMNASDMPVYYESSYTVPGIPATYIIGKDYKIRTAHVGAAEWDKPDALHFIQKLLDE